MVAEAYWIGGTGRSGTTAICRMLGLHPQVLRFQDEIRFQAVPAGYRALQAGTKSPEQFSQWMLKRRFRFTKPDGFEAGLHRYIEREPLAEALKKFERDYPQHPDTAMSALFRDVASKRLTSASKPSWAEATPDNAAAADLLLRVFRDSHLLISVRDGRDVIASLMGQNWGPETLADAFQWWEERTREISAARTRALREGFGDRVLVVHLEELAQDRSVFEALLQALGLETTHEVVEYYERNFTTSEASVGRWKSTFTDRQFADRYEAVYQTLVHDGVRPLPAPPTW